MKLRSINSSKVVGYAVGADGLIIKTTNCGQIWTTQSSGTSVGLNGVSFSNVNSGIAVGGGDFSASIILVTTDGGINWNSKAITHRNLKDVKFINDSVAYICGDNGTILKTTNGGIITEVEEILIQNKSILENYLLSQNYPNPFNPVTKIKYSIPYVETRHASSLQIVTLKVYDLLGREVATLVNEEKPAGEYEVEFDGTKLPTGIYFYQLKAGEYSETKKMILLR